MHNQCSLCYSGLINVKHKALSGFTLVELLVVMLIIAVLFGLGLGGLVSLRYSSELDLAYSEFVSMLQTLQNEARNSSVSKALLAAGASVDQGGVDGYAILFQTGNYSTRYCFETLLVGNPGFDCSGVEIASAKSAAAGNVRVTPLDSAACSAIVFERVSGDIYGLPSPVSAFVDAGTCLIELHHNVSGVTRQIAVDLTTNNFREI